MFRRKRRVRTIKGLEWEVKKRDYVIWGYIVLLLAVFFTMIFFLADTYKVHYEIMDRRPEVITINLTESEIQLVNKIVEDTKDYYLLPQKKITFVKTIQGDYEKIGGDEKTSPFILGFNYNNGIIYVEFTSNEDSLRSTYCHELLHTVVFGPNEEEIVESLEPYQPCFKSGIDRRVVVELR
jgi:hypothetical protein